MAKANNEAKMVRELLIHATHPQELKALWELKHSAYRADAEGIDLRQSARHDDDLTFCFKALRRVSRSFAVVIMHLPEGLREAVAVFYLVCRALDTVEDDPELQPVLKQELLRCFHQFGVGDVAVLRGVGDKPDYRTLVNHYDKVLRVLAGLPLPIQEIIREVAARMGAGMAEFTGRPIRTIEDYDAYCHYVAGLVGIGLTRLFEATGCERPDPARNEDTANHMGLFLQKTNIIRDYLEDVVSRRYFWPEEVWKPYAGELGALRNGMPRSAKLEILDRLVADALRHVPHCLNYLESLRHPQVFRFCAIPQVMAVATLATLTGHTGVFKREIKIRKGLAASLMLHTHTMDDVRRVFARSTRQMLKRCSGRAVPPVLVERLSELVALTSPAGPHLLFKGLKQMGAGGSEDHRYDAVVVGAGLAGCAAAITLARLGWQVALVEKQPRVPERIIGELMQPGGLDMLHSLGLSEALQDIDAQVITGYSLIHGSTDVVVPYPEGKTGLAFHHKRLLENLRALAAREPRIRLITGEVQELIFSPPHSHQVEGVYVQTGEEGMSFYAPLTIVADGAFSRFRAALCEATPEVTGHFLGLILKEAPLPHSSHGHVVVAGGHVCLVYPISSTETRILIDFPPGAPPRPGAALSEYLLTHLLPALPSVLQSPFERAVREGAFKAMPNHRFLAKTLKLKGVCLLGDAFSMRHPLTGGGMTAALTDVVSLRQLLEHHTPYTLGRMRLQKRLRRLMKRSRLVNGALNILADALYQTVKNPLMREACLHYLGKGGRRASEPMALLSALNRSQPLLLFHFFRVALEEAVIYLRQGTPQALRTTFHLLRDAWCIIAPQMRRQWL
ncbi:MAG: squalene synthase [Flavobacteriales bacterium]|nr:squalene synthase [Flavobacteriales bacterium]MDW8410975.1 squalene synthase [Flavobacteriales bacterium]